MTDIQKVQKAIGHWKTKKGFAIKARVVADAMGEDGRIDRLDGTIERCNTHLRGISTFLKAEQARLNA